ncbi:MAG: amidohydrolase [Desulfopila sp.]|jgi:5-methylthioadenosine/S-adenosylhomocysteine deaminase|nr:amidohydrolase [Desulfopila sp.]
MKQHTPEYIYTARYLLPSNTQKSVIENGGIVVQGDSIAAVGEAASLVRSYPEAIISHEEHGLIMPGLINGHTHAAMSCFRGLADDLPLMTWLEKHIFPIEAQLTGQMVYKASLLSIAEMIRSGTTSFCDMYLFAGDVARAADSAGIRAWVGEVLYDFPSPCYGDVENGISYIRDLHAEYRNHPLVSITTDPHSVYTCSPQLLTRLASLAADNNSLYVIHLSENRAEVQGCLDRYGLSPVHHLDKLGVLGPATLACHCVEISGDEFDVLRKRQVKVVHCVESNMKLASGIAPVVEMLRHGITVCLGTDGSASNNDVDMFREMSSVAKVQKVSCMDPTVMSAEETLQAATMGGAIALGAEKQIGSLEVGKKADFIVLDLHQPHLTPLYAIPSQLTYVAGGGDVIHSFVNGRQLMKNRELLTIDLDTLLAEMTNMSKTILQLRN